MQERWHSNLIGDVPTPLVMGILNVTPDSFSDGGAYGSVDAGVTRACAMVAEGARIIDVGPESTRPGSTPVPPDEQLRRAIPVIAGIRAVHPEIIVSIDTRSSVVARAAIERGATVVNDVSALRDDPNMAEVVRDSGASVVLMHRRGTPGTMQAGGGPVYDDVIAEITAFLLERIAWSEAQGIGRSQIILDPGIGFGKRATDNLKILQQVAHFVGLGLPVLIGASRKRFLGMTLGLDDPVERDAVSLVCAGLAVRDGASIIRSHLVKETVQTVALARAVRDA